MWPNKLNEKRLSALAASSSSSGPLRSANTHTLQISLEGMGDKKKASSIFVRLVSAAGTGFFYVKKKPAKRVVDKLEFRKYDPRVNRHVLFTEQKMK